MQRLAGGDEVKYFLARPARYRGSPITIMGEARFPTKLVLGNGRAATKTITPTLPWQSAIIQLISDPCAQLPFLLPLLTNQSATI